MSEPTPEDFMRVPSIMDNKDTGGWLPLAVPTGPIPPAAPTIGTAEDEGSN